MERIKRTFKKLTIKKSFALLILLFLLLDIFLCLATAGLLQLLPGKYYALSSPLIVCLYSALCLASAACLFYKCKLEEPLNLAYFRRLKRNILLINPYVVRKAKKGVRL